MPETVPVYNLVSFFRVLYVRRWFIVVLTAVFAALAAGVSLRLPETYRAHTTVTVAVPNYKETLGLLPKPVTVSEVRSMMTSPDAMNEVLGWTLALNQTLTALTGSSGPSASTSAKTESLVALEKAVGEKVGQKDALTLVAKADIRQLGQTLLAPGDPNLRKLPEAESQVWSLTEPSLQFLAILSLMNEEELRAIESMNASTIRATSPYALVGRLSAHTTITKETNLETEYSPLIDVYGEASTPEEAQAMTNLWLRVFRYRAEKIVRDVIDNETSKVLLAAEKSHAELSRLSQQRDVYLTKHAVDILETRVVATRLILYGVIASEERTTAHRGMIDVEDPEETPMWSERSSVSRRQSFRPGEGFTNALVPRYQRELADGAPTEELNRLDQQIEKIESELRTQGVELRKHRTVLEDLERRRGAQEANLAQLQPNLQQAQMLLAAMEKGSVADLRIEAAQKPDRLFSPERKQMTVSGALIGFALACLLCFLLDLWSEVVRPKNS